MVKKCYQCRGKMQGTRTYYRYTECGLDSVTLENILVYRCSACGSIMPEIPAIGELHRMIVLNVIEKPTLLSGQEIKFLRKMAGLNSKELASAIGASASTVSRWENNNRRISKKSDAALRLICFAGMLQEILGDRKLLDVIAKSTQKMSEVNIRKVIAAITEKESGPVPMSIDPRELENLGRSVHARELPVQ